MDFNKLNNYLYQESAPHRFNKKPSKYDEGYLYTSNWLNDLCYYFEQKRKKQVLNDEDEFMKLVEEQINKVKRLQPSLYKDGLLKALEDVDEGS